MNRYYYSDSVIDFISHSENSILGKLVQAHQFSLEDTQRNAWVQQIHILKKCLRNVGEGQIIFEYSIPRMGKRIDVVLLLNGLVFALEFKVGAKNYDRVAMVQVLDYALDLKNFHASSWNKTIIPILIATEAPDYEPNHSKYSDGVWEVTKSNRHTLEQHLASFYSKMCFPEIVPDEWCDSSYRPTPTIIEAARALYEGHNVTDISRSDSGAINLGKTSKRITEIINESKLNLRKSICFITGVPGAGKTLAGLDVANKKHKNNSGNDTVFLSGNQPLVKVLQEALACDEVNRNGSRNGKMTKRQALAKTKVFIQNIHHFRDDSLVSAQPPHERVVIFDEAQRAWSLELTKSFMANKRGQPGFEMSEPEFLIRVMDRHKDWAVIICLIGGGQEINKGEAGLPEWFSSLSKGLEHWNVYVTDQLSDFEYTSGKNLLEDIQNSISIEPDLHLGVSVRSFRSEKLSLFVKLLLSCDKASAIKTLTELTKAYPIRITRSLDKAKAWLKTQSRGSERIGLVASSGAHRLKPYGINLKNKIDPAIWFLNPETDIRSSSFLEDAATEFDIQGLELDWVCMCWGADLRKKESGWDHKKFVGTKWQNIQKPVFQQYLVNSYRVLLTRARQGMIIFIPEGCDSDNTRQSYFYDNTFEYLKEIGLQEV